MIHTKQQYDHVRNAMTQQGREQMVRLGPGETVVEALVHQNILYVSSYHTTGKVWIPVVRDMLADGLQPPGFSFSALARAPQGGGTLPPTPSSISAEWSAVWDPNQAAANSPSLDPDILQELIKDSVTWQDPYMPQQPLEGMSLGVHSSSHVDDAPQSFDLLHMSEPASPSSFLFPSLWPATASGAETFGSANNAPGARENPAPLFSQGDFLAAVFEPKTTGFPKTRTAKKQFVDPDTGDFLATRRSGAILEDTYIKNQRRVDKHGARGASEIVSRARVYYRQRMQEQVDPKTGAKPTSSSAPTVSRGAYYGRRMVDPRTGKLATSETVGAKTWAAFKTHRYKTKQVDPQTGMPPTSEGIKTISYKQYRLNLLVDPETGKDASFETLNPITRRDYQKKRNIANDVFDVFTALKNDFGKSMRGSLGHCKSAIFFGRLYGFA